jgi:hypothetical protein
MRRMEGEGSEGIPLREPAPRSLGAARPVRGAAGGSPGSGDARAEPGGGGLPGRSARRLRPGDAGRCAYAALSAALARGLGERLFAQLYEELADRFRDFADLLALVGERARRRPPAITELQARFLATASPRDRRRLLALGALAPEVPARGLPH